MKPDEAADSAKGPRQWPPRFGRLVFRVLTAAVPLSVALWIGAVVPGAFCLALAVAWLGLAHLGSFYAPSGIFGPTLLHGPAARPLVALTFDDGPDPQTTPRVLELLAQHGARATFFVIGERAAQHPQVVAAIAQAGHQIESHSLRHSWWTAFTPRRVLAAELRAAQVAIAAASGREPRWFRPPIGILSPEVVAAAQRVGLRLCGWSCKARDGLLRTSVPAALMRLRAGLRPGAILLLHDAPPHPGPPATATGVRRHQPIAPALLEALLPELAERQLRSVTLDELLGPAPGL